MVALSAKGRDALDQAVAKTIKEANLSGFIFGATTAEGEIYVNGGGDRVLNDPASGQVTPDSVFWICSQTKLITHLAALQLIERGHLHEDDPVSDYVPEFTNLIVLDDITKEDPSYTPAKEIVRVKHLLNSTAGLFYSLRDADRNGQTLPYSSPHSKEDPIGEFFRLLKGNLPGIPLKFEPGTDFAYGFCSDVLGFVIERATKITLEEYLKQNIFHPLGIKASFYLTPDLKEKKVAFVLRNEGDLLAIDPNVKLFETDPEKVHLRLGGVGLYASARGYLALLRHLLQICAGTASSPVFSKEIVSSIFTPALNEAGQKSVQDLSFFDPFSPWNEGMQWSTALAVNLEDWPGRRKKGSGNWLGWANTFHFIDPTTGVAAVFNTQVLPPLNRDVMEYAAKFETTLYGGLEYQVPRL